MITKHPSESSLYAFLLARPSGRLQSPGSQSPDIFLLGHMLTWHLLSRRHELGTILTLPAVTLCGSNTEPKATQQLPAEPRGIQPHQPVCPELQVLSLVRTGNPGHSPQAPGKEVEYQPAKPSDRQNELQLHLTLIFTFSQQDGGGGRRVTRSS